MMVARFVVYWLKDKEHAETAVNDVQNYYFHILTFGYNKNWETVLRVAL